MPVIKEQYDDGYLTVLEPPVICFDCPNKDICLLWVLDLDLTCQREKDIGPICVRCESRGKITRDTVWMGKSTNGALLYKCNECGIGFYG